MVYHIPHGHGKLLFRSSKVNIVATSIRNQTNSADLTVLVIQNFNVHPDGRNKRQIVQLVLGKENTVSRAALRAGAGFYR